MMASMTRKMVGEAKRLAEKESKVTRALVLSEIKRIEKASIDPEVLISLSAQLKRIED